MCVCVCVCVFHWPIFRSSALMKLQMSSCLNICIASDLSSHQIMWHKKKNLWSCFRTYMLLLFFSFFEETKFEVDTTSIILSSIYQSLNVNE